MPRVPLGHRLTIDPFDAIGPIRAALAPIRLKLDLDLIITKAISQAVGMALGKAEPPALTLLGQAFRDYREEQEKLGFHDFSHNPHRFEISIGRSEHGNHLALVRCENDELIRAFRRLPFVERYACWTGSERPSGLTVASWRQRQSEWDALIGDGAVYQTTLAFELETSPYSLELQSIAWNHRADTKRLLASSFRRAGTRAIRSALQDHVVSRVAGILEPNLNAGRLMSTMHRAVTGYSDSGGAENLLAAMPPISGSLLRLQPEELSVKTLDLALVEQVIARAVRSAPPAGH